MNNPDVHCLSEKRGCRTCKHNLKFEKTDRLDETGEFELYECICEHHGSKPIYLTKLSGCYNMYDEKEVQK